MKDEFKKEIIEEKEELKEDFQEFKKDLKNEFCEEKEDFEKELAKLTADFKDGVKEMQDKIEEELEEGKEEFAKKMIDKNEDEAEELLKDKSKMEEFLEKLEEKLALVPMIGEKLTDIPVLISMVRSYVKKEYTEIPVSSIIAVIAALIYFVSPMDVIADAIPVIGYLDDLAVLSWVLKMVHDDLNDYRSWKEKKK